MTAALLRRAVWPVVVVSTVLSTSLVSDARADVRRGAEASSENLPGRVVQAGTLFEGSAIRVDLRRPRRWAVALQPSKAVRVRLAGCRGRVRVGTSRSRLRSYVLDGLPRTIRVPTGHARATHAIHLARPAHGRACLSVLVDRADVEAPLIPLGAALRSDFLATAPGYRSAFLERFEALTPENEMKMEVLQPARGRFAFGAADRLVDLAREHRMPVRGHTLVYDRQLPRWLTDPMVPWTRASLLEVMRQHISTVVQRYRGRVDRWDVVNEAVDGNGALKRSLWQRVIGDDYIGLAFRFAREADPTARLVYNDHTLERPAPHQDGVYRLLADLRARGVPIDGIGFQAHIAPGNVPTAAELDKTFSRFASLGLRLEVTEADAPFPGPATPQRIAEQTDHFSRLANACWEHVGCDRMTVWGVDDGHSWLGVERGATLLDPSLGPKPAYAAARDALRGRRSR